MVAKAPAPLEDLDDCGSPRSADHVEPDFSPLTAQAARPSTSWVNVALWCFCRRSLDRLEGVKLLLLRLVAALLAADRWLRAPYLLRLSVLRFRPLERFLDSAIGLDPLRRRNVTPASTGLEDKASHLESFLDSVGRGDLMRGRCETRASCGLEDWELSPLLCRHCA
mmetsp:Transcript_8054/g.20020  ORF Transcript_8054/g.20020 Transcript_8054/m.20020 type:complete len:167 (-) Transcript_8054:548-1048(-)